MAQKRKALRRSRPSRKVNAAAEAKLLTEGKLVRLSVQLAPETHRALKVRAASTGQTIRNYIVELLRRDGIPVPDAE